jgi:hypothetical protein
VTSTIAAAPTRALFACICMIEHSNDSNDSNASGEDNVNKDDKIE